MARLENEKFWNATRKHFYELFPYGDPGLWAFFNIFTSPNRKLFGYMQTDPSALSRRGSGIPTAHTKEAWDALIGNPNVFWDESTGCLLIWPLWRDWTPDSWKVAKGMVTYLETVVQSLTQNSDAQPIFPFKKIIFPKVQEIVNGLDPNNCYGAIDDAMDYLGSANDIKNYPDGWALGGLLDTGMDRGIDRGTNTILDLRPEILDSGSKNIDTTQKQPEPCCCNSHLQPIPFKEIIRHLNQQARTNYRHTTKSYQRLIQARWDEGHHLADFIRAIDYTVATADFNPTFNKFLKPTELFLETNFNSCLKAAQATKDVVNETTHRHPETRLLPVHSQQR